MIARVVALLVVALALAAPAHAQQKADLYDIEDEVMCVSCNVPLFIAESPQADRQRALIRGYIDDGLTKEQIKTRLVAECGEDVLAMPDSDDGTGLAAKLVPIVTLIALALLLALLIPRWRRAQPVPATGAPTATSAELKRVDDDLERLG